VSKVAVCAAVLQSVRTTDLMNASTTPIGRPRILLNGYLDLKAMMKGKAKATVATSPHEGNSGTDKVVDNG